MALYKFRIIIIIIIRGIASLIEIRNTQLTVYRYTHC